jgi:hypothetical protein
MTDWTSGYIADIGYTYGYYNELNPLRAELAFLHAGYKPPSQGIHCELGFGQGLSINIHAAASGCEWYGNDFNPSQAAFAKELAQLSGAKLYLTDESFAEFCNRSDLPEFDSIGLHGIWSWISDENRKQIAEFIQKKLKVGGAVYVSYNTLPGWANFAPMRHLMTQHANTMGSQGEGIVNRVNAGLDFAEKLLATDPLFGKVNPGISDRLQKVKDQNRHYLAHEYFNKDWHPMYFSTMNEWLSPSKMTYVCSAHYLDHVDVINLNENQQKLLNQITDKTYKETSRDFIVNQQFRRDYWIKGPRKLSVQELNSKIQKIKLILTVPLESINYKVNGALGEAKLNDNIYEPIVKLMSNYKVWNIADICIALQKNNLISNQILQALIILVGLSYVMPVQSDELIDAAIESSKKLNSLIIEKSKENGEITFLASPLTGGGIGVNRFQQLFLKCISDGKNEPSEWANYVWSILAEQKQKIIKDGKALQKSEENLNELLAQAKKFQEVHRPILNALLIC